MNLSYLMMGLGLGLEVGQRVRDLGLESHLRLGQSGLGQVGLGQTGLGKRGLGQRRLGQGGLGKRGLR